MMQPARLLEPHENIADQIRAILDKDPVTNCFLYSRLAPLFDVQDESTTSISTLIGGEVWLYEENGQLESLCYVGANLVPTPSSDSAIESFIQRARRTGKYSSSIVGPRNTVLPLWEGLERVWGPARTVRENQPLLVIDQHPEVTQDPSVRQVELAELRPFFTASVAMFTEELGISPIGADGGALYQMKVAELILAGFAFARFEDGEVIFKCEIGALSPSVCQIQGVWTKPSRRGQGLGTHGLATTVEIALEMAPAVCLYVNDFNLAARRSYEKIGFREEGAFASVLF